MLNLNIFLVFIVSMFIAHENIILKEYSCEKNRGRIFIINSSDNITIDSVHYEFPGIGYKVSTRKVKPNDFLICNYPNCTGNLISAGYWVKGEYFKLK